MKSISKTVQIKKEVLESKPIETISDSPERQRVEVTDIKSKIVTGQRTKNKEQVNLPTACLKMDSTPKRARIEEEEIVPKSKGPSKFVTSGAVPSGFELQDSSSDTFEVVLGRLTMAAETNYYRVTTQEMRRRIDGVEQLNMSNLACNLKRSKENGGGERLRQELESKGIQVERNRRQACLSNNTLIALTEGEAVHLARDLEEICEEIYPVIEIAQEVVDEAEEISKEDLENFQFCMTSMRAVFDSVVPPISGLRPKASMSKSLNHGMEALSQGSHGFGIVSQPNWFRQISLIGEEMEKIVEKKDKKDEEKK